SKTPPTCGSDPQGLKTRRTCGSELAYEGAGAVAENLYIRDYAFASKLAQDQRCCRTPMWLENTTDLRE
ncbi:hypothetical protein ACQJ22_26995, partial [Pseudomonas fragariae (ex Marin et al. 2024)]